MKRIIAAIAFLPMFCTAGQPLPVDKAFEFGYSKNKDNIVAIWKIENGYHLYKSKIKVSPEGAAKIAEWPNSVMMHDKEFGDQEMYSGQLILNIKILDSSKKIFITYQGCKLNELCYMPQRVELK